MRENRGPREFCVYLQQGAQSVTSLNYLTFFHADINQSQVEDSFQLASDWIKSVRKDVN